MRTYNNQLDLIRINAGLVSYRLCPCGSAETLGVENDMEIILAIATILGGITAIWFLYEKYRQKDRWQEEDKIVDSAWWESSELKKLTDAQGYKYRWSNPEKVAGRKAFGYSIIYEEDKKSKMRCRLINKSGQVLIGKKDESSET